VTDVRTLRAKTEAVAEAIRIEVIDVLPEEIRRRVTVFGGAVRDLILGKEVNDYDLMVADDETEAKLISFFDECAQRESINARHANYEMNGKKMQVLRGIYFPAEASVVANLSDYTICCCAVTAESIATHVDFFSDLAENRLRLNRVSFPLATLERLQKFALRGFVADHDTLLILASAIQRADLDASDSVKLQLPGINSLGPRKSAAQGTIS
jgi:hypothetical protein